MNNKFKLNIKRLSTFSSTKNHFTEFLFSILFHTFTISNTLLPKAPNQLGNTHSSALWLPFG